jgi:hypothetical protein
MLTGIQVMSLHILPSDAARCYHIDDSKRQRKRSLHTDLCGLRVRNQLTPPTPCKAATAWCYDAGTITRYTRKTDVSMPVTKPVWPFRACDSQASHLVFTVCMYGQRACVDTQGFSSRDTGGLFGRYSKSRMIEHIDRLRARSLRGRRLARRLSDHDSPSPH